MSLNEPRAQAARGGSSASAWLIAVLLTASAAAFLASLAAWQVTSEETGGRLLQRASVAIAGLDEAAPGLAESLHEAAAANENPEITVPDYPIIIPVARNKALSISPAELHALLAEESARRIYHEGMGVWAEADDQAFQDVERASATGAVKYGLELIRDSNHTIFGAFALFFGAVSFVLLVLLAIVVRGAYARFLAVGAVLIAAALPLLAAAVAVRFAFKSAQPDDDPFERAILDVGVEAMSVPIRDFLAVTLLGLATAGIGTFLMWRESRQISATASYDADSRV